METSLIAELKGQDRLEVLSLQPFQMRVIGCRKMWDQLKRMRDRHGLDVVQWPLLRERDHASLLINELILKLRNQWKQPYLHEEVCHCRSVSLETVEQAILNGAQTPEMVSKWTMASTACGTCRPDVEKIIQYRLSAATQEPGT
jgi:bacterioferritin-associated ferredoxin